MLLVGHKWRMIAVTYSVDAAFKVANNLIMGGGKEFETKEAKWVGCVFNIYLQNLPPTLLFVCLNL